MSNTPLAHDLALKRTVHAPTEQKPIYAWRDVITNVEINLPPIVLLCPHGEERFDMAEVADTLGKALTNVFISQGEKDIFTDKNRAWVAQICRELGGNLTEMARKQNPLRLTLNALYELIEKTLVDNNAYMVAKSLLLNRSRKLSVKQLVVAPTRRFASACLKLSATVPNVGPALIGVSYSWESVQKLSNFLPYR